MKIGPKNNVIYQVWLTYSYLDNNVDTAISKPYLNRELAEKKLDEFLCAHILRARQETANGNLYNHSYFLARAEGAYIKEFIINKKD